MYDKSEDGFHPLQDHVTFVDHNKAEQREEPDSLSPGVLRYRRRHSALGTLPDPALIRMHTAIANVLHLSGAAEIFDFLRERSVYYSLIVSGDCFMKNLGDFNLELYKAARGVVRPRS